ncbi:hypothetical protein [Thermochromatium tepidum]|jgi:hypothetical protein|uniref:Uncharacterized protein n=1 Tax=Thermochromatium tepidum ATCC 43061 TaxID=316276 RepID=A0A6I6E4I9_THETI|nr:hypothetical protein [Thermochromatium tepidum]QGU32692.1 hypothetical protein E6P07_06675 [Thermochromatium tepidum ATCC 43061]
MIEGIIGMLVALLVFVLIALFSKRTPNPAIALPLNTVMTSQGFTLLDSADPILKAIKDAYRLTGTTAFIEQTYKRPKDGCIICWLADSDGANNHLVAALIQNKTDDTGIWVMLCLPGLQGAGGNLIRKSFALSLSSSALQRIESGAGQAGRGCELYVKRGDPLPSFKEGFLDLLQSCGNLILRVMDSVILIERLSLNRTETWEREAKELLRLTEALRAGL